MIFFSFSYIHPHAITITKTENRDFAIFFFSEKGLIDTLAKVIRSEIVIVTVSFHLPLK